MSPAGETLGAAWRDPRGRTGALLLALIAILALAGPLVLPDPAMQFDPVDQANRTRTIRWGRTC